MAPAGGIGDPLGICSGLVALHCFEFVHRLAMGIVKVHLKITNEPVHDRTYNNTCVSSKDSD